MLTETFSYNNLFAGNVMPVVTDKATITGGTYTAGTVLGRITASGKLKKVDSTAIDGSQTIYAILADDVDASLADAPGAIYLTGEFNESKLIFGGTDTADTHRFEARKIGIFFKTAIQG